MGQITFKGGSIQFKGGSLKFLSYTPMVAPTVDASWSKPSTNYIGKVTIKNNDSIIARIWYRINDFPAQGQFMNLSPGETFTYESYNSPAQPPSDTSLKVEAYARDIDSLKPDSEEVSDISFSP